MLVVPLTQHTSAKIHTHLSVAQLLVQEIGIMILFRLPLSALPVWLVAREQGVLLVEFLWEALCTRP